VSTPDPPRVFLYLLLASFVILTLAYQSTAPVIIEVGSGRDTAFVQGFSFRENLAVGDPSTVGSAGFRWSGARAEIRLWGLGNQNGTLKLGLAAPRPSGTERVQLYANDTRLGEFEPGAAFQEFAFPIDRGAISAGGDLIVTLVGDTFTQPPDTRMLGVQVNYARFESRGAPVVPSPRALYLIALTLLALVGARLWSGSALLAMLIAALVMLTEAAGLVVARVDTVWFAAPLFWSGLAILIGALALTWVLRQPSLTRNGAPLPLPTVRALFAAMALAFAVRMIFAIGPGFIVDVQDYVVWSYKTVTYGLGTAYTALNGLWIADQSPGLVYLLHVMGIIYRAVFSPDFLYPGVAGDPSVRAANALVTNPALLADPVQRTLLRMPSLLADLVTGALIFAVARKNLSERTALTPRSWLAWLVALGYWFNPAVLWNGAYWGQTDAVHALLVLVAFLLLGANRIGASFFTLGVAVLTKPQAAIFGPLLLLWVWREARWRGAARALIAGALGAGLMLAPMLLAGGGNGMFAYFLDTIGHHPILSANAHNLWWFLQNGKIDVPDTSQIVPGIPLTYRQASLILFLAFYLAALAKAWRTSREDHFALGAFVGFAFFMLPTEIHENYGYALLPLLANALTRDKTWLAFYVAVSATMVLNYALSDPPLFALFGIADPAVQLALPRQLNSVANTAIFAAWALYLFARRRVVIRSEPSLEPQGVMR
jgi:Gpi18-like mannosyltransferase